MTENKEKEHMNIVIVGHVDHGKSTLIGRLFYDTDSLPSGKLQDLEQASKALGRELEFSFVLDHLEEEREQGITIDTAQTFFNTEKRNYTIIDAPGHVEFVKNMITGASQAESAVLIVDVFEGVREQTRRHAYILGMLGLRQVIVVINKMDLIEYDEKKFEEVKKDILGFLEKINIKPSYVIPISAKKGDNIAKKSENLGWYDGKTILEALDSFDVREEEEEKPLRFPVQDIYDFDRKIAAGKIVSGRLKKYQEIVVLPQNKKTRIKAIEIFNGELEEAMVGESIGVVTEDVSIEGGNVLVDKNIKPKVTNEIKASIFWLDNQPYKEKEKLLFKCATQEAECRIDRIERKIDSSSLETIKENSDKIENREVANVTIKTEKPVVIENFNTTPEMGRFVLERNDTVAGGIITNM